MFFFKKGSESEIIKRTRNQSKERYAFLQTRIDKPRGKLQLTFLSSSSKCWRDGSGEHEK